MADRTSARLFGEIFQLLAENPTEENKLIALKIYDKAGEYDFSWYQMDADESLVTLGLAKRGIDPDYPEEGETILYK